MTIKPCNFTIPDFTILHKIFETSLLVKDPIMVTQLGKKFSSCIQALCYCAGDMEYDNLVLSLLYVLMRILEITDLLEGYV